MSFPGRLLELPIGRVFVHQGGSGPPLVLLHGMFVSHFYFRPILDELQRHFSVTAIDLPGHGESDSPPPDRFGYDIASYAAVVEQVLGKLGIASAHVLGHSMGGGIAVTLAARHPERVQRLVAADPWIYPMELPFLGRLALTPAVGAFVFMRLYSRRDMLRHFRTCYRDPALATEELVDYYWERFNRAGSRAAALASLKSFAGLPDNSGDPGRVRTPALIVWGEEDHIIPLMHGKRLVRQVPGARLVVVPACGHSPHEERPELFLREVLPFLAGTAPLGDGIPVEARV